MKLTSEFRYPEEKWQKLKKVKKLEWITIAYLTSVVILLYFALGSSQAMKGAWLEDMFSLVPASAFLIAQRIARRTPSATFPYGYYRVETIAFLCGAVALLGMGSFLLIDSIMKLMMREHPTIGTVVLFDQVIWMGWIMIPALVYSAIPAVILGRMKLKPAEDLHNNVLFSDAKMNEDDWLTAMAAIIGVLGIGYGFWWADSAAAGFISLNVIYDGVTNLRTAVKELMQKIPTTIQENKVDPLCDRIQEELGQLDWVQHADFRLREDGVVYFCEVFLVPEHKTVSVNQVEDARRRITELDWKLHDVVVSLVKTIEPSADLPDHKIE